MLQVHKHSSEKKQNFEDNMELSNKTLGTTWNFQTELQSGRKAWITGRLKITSGAVLSSRLMYLCKEEEMMI